MIIGKVLSQRALITPEREAMIVGDRTLTFDQLNKRANRLANTFLKLGVNPGDRIGLLMFNGNEFIDELPRTPSGLSLRVEDGASVVKYHRFLLSITLLAFPTSDTGIAPVGSSSISGLTSSSDWSASVIRVFREPVASF